MTKITSLTAAFATAGALTAADFANAKRQGFKTIINFRPDHEADGQLNTSDAQSAAAAVGLGYFHIPARKHELFADTLVTEAARVLDKATGPVLAYCASGQRAAIVWAAASARTQPVDTVLSTLKGAGFDLAFLRDDLEAQADRARWDAHESEKPASNVAATAEELEAA